MTNPLNFPPLPVLLLATGKWGLVAMVLAALVYFPLRAFESRTSKGTLWLETLGCAFIVAVTGVMWDEHTRWFVVALILVNSSLIGALGAALHRKSGGRARNWAVAFLLMGFAALSVDENFLVLMKMRVLSMSPPLPLVLSLPQAYCYGSAFFLFFTLPVALMPFSLWVWQNLKLRPGTDRNFEEGEVRS